MSQLHLHRYLIETTAPMAISTGGRETGFDTQLARDANGLPYIPATSFAGVWRHLVQSTLGEEAANRWFGYISSQGSEGSKLFIQNGLLVDNNSQPIMGLVPPHHIENNPFLQRLSTDNPLHRDRVRINDRGVASDKAKFDQILLPKGLRFVIDVRWQGESDEWQHIETLLASPLFALGASTRNGLGRFTIKAADTKTLALQNNPKAGDTLQRFMARNTLPTGKARATQTYKPFATLSLKAWDAWRSGKGARPIGEADSHTDSFTYSEPYITWQGDNARWSTTNQVVLCGSSIKGILAHRLAYHWRRINEQWAENMEEKSHAEWQERPEALAALLGKAGDSPEESLAGSLIVPDVIISNPKPFIRHHNRIDRFTGGVQMGALFSEELLWQPEFEVVLYLDPNVQVTPSLKAAVEATLSDLEHGLLPLGAGAGRGASLVSRNENGPWQVELLQLNEVEDNQEQEASA